MFSYSVDKLKLQIYFKDLSFVESLCSNLLTQAHYFKSNYKEMYDTCKITSCFKSFILEHLDGNLYIGFNPNWIKQISERSRTVILEYNPNKVKLEYFPELFTLLKNAYTIKIMSCDIAVDMFDIKLDDMLIQKWDNRVAYNTFSKSTLETAYIGSLGHGHIKIYDKAIEQKLKDGTVWTRFEITLKDIGDYKDFRGKKVFDIKDFNLPILYNRNFQANFEFESLKDKDKFYFYSYLLDNTLIKFLDIKTRKKILALAYKYLKKIEIDKKAILQCINDFIIT